jgi:DNA-binding CsgD family transcriptional regulator
MLARTTYLEAMNAAYFAGRLARGAGIAEVSRAALAAPAPPDPPRPRDLLLHALAIRSTEGYAAAAPLLKQALGTFLSDTSLQADEAHRLVMASWAAGDLWDDETWGLLSARHVGLVREAGALTAIPIVLDPRTAFHAMSGELAAAASLVVEMQAAAEATGIPTHPYGALSLAALRGQDTKLSELESTLRDAVSRGEGAVLAYAPFAKATLYNGLAQYDDALDAARQAGQRADDLGAQTWAVPELIEAAVRCGKPELAGPALERLVETTQASGTDWALGTEARSRALLSDDETAESLYREAIERLQRTHMRVDLARAHLLYGEWLRREDRRIDAREPLRAAHEMFMAMGAAAFAERARLEMLATGEKVRKPTVESRDELTAQERQIARLARDGLSNAEIASRMFISRHTVAYHLRKVFSKLGISSRNQLDRVLPGSASAGQVA